MKLFLFILLLTFCLSAQAGGNRVGNGGDVVSCKTTKELLDLYESSAPLKSFRQSAKYQENLETILKNLDRISPNQGRAYRNKVQDFMENTEWRSKVSLINIKDSKHLFRPKDKDCNLLQIAIRRATAGGSLKRFIIDKELWDALSERSKAALVLHEVIYEHFFKLGEEDSIKARAINAYLFSEKAFEDSPEVYWRMIKELKLPIYK